MINGDDLKKNEDGLKIKIKNEENIKKIKRPKKKIKNEDNLKKMAVT